MAAGMTIPVFSFALVCGVSLSIGIVIWRTGWRLGSVVDLALGAGIGSVVGGRIEHVALQWAYFSTARDEIARVTLGGLEWHGAFVGGLIGLWLVIAAKNITQRRKGAKTQSIEIIFGAAALVIPVLALAGWIGCYAAPCAWGKEVTTLADYAPWAVGWTRDVFNIYAPRYNTQLYGMALAVMLMVLAWLLRQRRGAGRFWLIVGLLSVGMFFIGFWRADFVPSWFGLRVDQVFDGILAGIALTLSAVGSRKLTT